MPYRERCPFGGTLGQGSPKGLGDWKGSEALLILLQLFVVTFQETYKAWGFSCFILGSVFN